MPPGHNAVTYVQADVRFALTALLVISSGSHTRVRNVKGIHACPHLVAFQLSLCSDRWTLCLGSFWINYKNYLWSCVRPVPSLICFCVLCFPNKDFMNKKHWEEKKIKKRENMKKEDKKIIFKRSFCILNGYFYWIIPPWFLDQQKASV